MSNAMQSFLRLGIHCICAIVALCSGVKVAMKNLLKGGQKHDD